MSAPMLDPAWTPAAGCGHAADLISICDRNSTTTHEGGRMTTSTRRATPAKKPTSIKIPARAYATAQRVAKRERRTITAVVELAIESYAAAGSSS